jgi:hypothetical protein
LGAHRKTRKAVKRLNKVDSLLTNIIGGIAEMSNGVGDLLASARESILRAKAELDSEAPDTVAKKAPARVVAPRKRRLTAEGRKRISLAAKKRWDLARRKGINPVTGQRLKKSA